MATIFLIHSMNLLWHYFCSSIFLNILSLSLYVSINLFSVLCLLLLEIVFDVSIIKLYVSCCVYFIIISHKSEDNTDKCVNNEWNAFMFHLCSIHLWFDRTEYCEVFTGEQHLEIHEYVSIIVIMLLMWFYFDWSLWIFKTISGNIYGKMRESLLDSSIFFGCEWNHSIKKNKRKFCVHEPT